METNMLTDSCRRILIAEDDPKIIAMLGVGLQKYGYDFDTASDGVEALEMLQKNHYAVGVYDIMMPRMDGIELLAYTTEIDRYIQVIMITGAAEVGMVIEILKQGAFSFLRKPFEIDEILNIINNAFRQRQLLIENENYKKNLENLVEQRTQELLQSKEELQLEKEKLENALSSIGTGFIVVNPEGKLIWRNKILRKWLGELNNWSELFSDQSGVTIDIDEAVFDKGKSFSKQITKRCLDGEHREFKINFSPIRETSGRIVQAVALIRDVTESNRLERELLRSERLASMGEIVAGLAHEINNPMGIILGLVQNILAKMDDSDPDHEDLLIIEKETRRTTQVIKSLVEFSNQPIPNKTKINIGEMIESSIRFLDYIFREKNIKVDLESEKDIPFINGDPDQLKQVIVNLFLNSIHAMSAGGAIKIKLQQYPARTPGEKDYISFIISDTGTGIPREDMPYIFNPFFTKKGKKGTGLGLSISKRIIEGHGGKIIINSEIDKGTECKIILPI